MSDTDLGLPERVAYRHLLAKVLLRDHQGKIQVSGTPEELRHLMKELRVLGFSPSQNGKTWYADYLDRDARKNLERLIAWYGKRQSDPQTNSDWSTLMLEVGGL